MSEEWKRIVCQQDECFQRALDAKGKVRSEFYLKPEIDTEEVTQFRCPHCGTVETWGPTRRKIARILWEKYNNA